MTTVEAVDSDLDQKHTMTMIEWDTCQAVPIPTSLCVNLYHFSGVVFVLFSHFYNVVLLGLRVIYICGNILPRSSLQLPHTKQKIFDKPCMRKVGLRVDCILVLNVELFWQSA